jgi:hypothetical protein
MSWTDPEVEHFFESHLGHLICAVWWTMCSCSKEILQTEIIFSTRSSDAAHEVRSILDEFRRSGSGTPIREPPWSSYFRRLMNDVFMFQRNSPYRNNIQHSELRRGSWIRLDSRWAERIWQQKTVLRATLVILFVPFNERRVRVPKIFFIPK